MTARARRAIGLRGLSFVVLCLATVLAAATGLPDGKGTFRFTDAKGDPSRPVTVYTYVPPGVDGATAPIVFVMHGVTKDAEGYRDTWLPLADRGRFVIVAPLFDGDDWGGGAYSHGNVVARDGRLVDPERWSFTLIEHLFDAVKGMTGNPASGYFLYGHSEGGQFVHRLVMLLPDGRYRRAVAANAGWYAMPTGDVAFPFGTQGAPIDDASLCRSFARDLVILLGDRDVDPNHRQLNRTPRAMAQGATRWERGHRFFEVAEARAK